MKKLLLIVNLNCLIVFNLFAEGIIKGVVKDPVSGETIIGASVVLENGKGTVTDLDGKFSILAEDGEHTIQISFIGYDSFSQKIKVDAKGLELSITMAVKNTKTLREIEVVSEVAKTRETPVAFSSISAVKLTEELGTRDVTAILNTAPGVYATESGGGAGDSRITVRGFDQRYIAVMVDGVPLNDMETGQVFWSNVFNIPASSIQLQRGLGASKLAIASIGGTLNIVTQGMESRRKGMFSQSLGTGNSNETKFAYNSGFLNGGFGFTAGFTHRKEDGLVDKAWAEIWSYFFKVQYRTLKNLVSFAVTGAPQVHGQRSFKRGIAIYDRAYAEKQGLNVDSIYSVDPNANNPRGLNYNSNWGTYVNSNGNTVLVNQAVNEFHKPLFNLTDSWNITDKLYFTNVAYVSIGKGGGSGFFSSSNVNYDKNTGQFDLQQLYDNNSTNIDGYFDTTLHKSTNILRQNVNNHFWYGLISTLRYSWSKSITSMLGFDYRNYTGYHYQKVYDLLGGDYFKNSSDLNQIKGGPTPLHPNNVYQMKREGDKIGYNYDGKVKWRGLFLQNEYKSDKFSAFITITGSKTNYERIDYFKRKDLILDGTKYAQIVGAGETFYYNGTDTLLAKSNAIITSSGDTTFVKNPGKTKRGIVNSSYYTNESSEAQYSTISPPKWFSNYTVKGGANYNINSQNNVFINLGYLNIAPRLNSVIDNSNRLFGDYRNMIVKAIEGGYGLKLKGFTFNLNAYYTIWENKPAEFSRTATIQTNNGLDEIAVSYQINNINALHKGIEGELHYKLFDFVELEFIGSFGDWKYTNTDTVYLINSATGEVAGRDFFSAKGVHVGNAAQQQISVAARIKIVKGIWIKPRFTQFDKLYANFDPANLKDSNSDRDSWKVPKYNVIDVFGGARVFDSKDYGLSLNFSVLNILNAKYLLDADNGTNFDANTATVFFGLQRRYTVGLRLDF